MPASDELKRLAELKARLRGRARAARGKVRNADAAARALVDRFMESPWSKQSGTSVVSGYWPINSEIDCRPLLRHLNERGARTALPVVEIVDAPLTFRLWDGGAPAARDALGMAVPAGEAEKVVPDVVLVPLLLADSVGHRLGYGGGYYDRTLKVLRQMGQVTALGLAFDLQLTDRLPAGTDDMTLDGVITEKRWQAF